MTAADTLFDVAAPPVARRRTRLAGVARPVWSKYTAVKRHRCDECVEVALETWPGPMPGVALARQQRRQSGVTRLYCDPHAQAQRAEDREKFPTRGAGASTRKARAVS